MKYSDYLNFVLRMAHTDIDVLEHNLLRGAIGLRSEILEYEAELAYYVNKEDCLNELSDVYFWITYLNYLLRPVNKVVILKGDPIDNLLAHAEKFSRRDQIRNQSQKARDLSIMKGCIRMLTSYYFPNGTDFYKLYRTNYTKLTNRYYPENRQY